MSAQIRFVCPTCKDVMVAPVSQAGKKANCPKCGQRLQIPPPERSKTILAASLGVEDDEQTSGQPASGNSGPQPTTIWAQNKPAKLPLPPQPSPTQSDEARSPSSKQTGSTPIGDSSTPVTVMVAAALLLAYGGFMLFCSCSEFALTATSANQQGPQFRQPIESKALALDLTWTCAKCFISIILLVSGLGVFRGIPVARWSSFASLGLDFFVMTAGTVALFVIANLERDQHILPAQGLLAIGLIGRFIPFAFWLVFTIPICVLLCTPSARQLFSSRSFSGSDSSNDDDEEEYTDEDVIA